MTLQGGQSSAQAQLRTPLHLILRAPDSTQSDSILGAVFPGGGGQISKHVSSKGDLEIVLSNLHLIHINQLDSKEVNWLVKGQPACPRSASLLIPNPSLKVKFSDIQFNILFMLFFFFFFFF